MKEKVKSLECLGNKYPYSVFNLSRTCAQEIKSGGVISNCQSYILDLAGRRYNFINGPDLTNLNDELKQRPWELK